ncbi:hypothetical protein C4D60_Mb05t05500 [Musa balbisiana]|uniref:Cytochrome P450 n=1 Tax=Musa balbisiana TaxID=52838 RepID=A0A4V4H7Y3_MUSBA|nr:hypothetical protein C4D60_Mb05t05500 [Musa balbisiana]
MEVATVLVVVACMVAYVVWFTRLASGLRGPRVWPVVGSLPGLIQHSERMHEWISDNLRGTGGTYQTCICALPGLARRQGLVTVTCDPRNLEHVLKNRFDNYPKGPTWHAVFLDLLGDGIFNSDGDTWLFQRKTAALEFTTRTLRTAMSRWVGHSIHLRLLPILEESSAKSTAVDLQDLLLRLTFDNICGLAFGKDPETLAPGLPENAFATAFDRATEASLRRFIFPEFVWRFKKWLQVGLEATLSRSVAHVDCYLSAIIKARKLELRDGRNYDDLLSRFMKKGTYTDSFLQHVVLNFILAGRDTSSVALCWFFWLVSTNPAVEHRILLELAAVLGESPRQLPDPSAWLASPLAFEEIDGLVYLKAAPVRDTPAVPVRPEDSKYVMADDVLPDGTFVPRRASSVTYSIYSAGRMNSVWGDDCLEFRPDRWLSPDGKRHRLRVAPGHRVEQKMSLTLFMKNGLRMDVQDRDLTAMADELRTTQQPPEVVAPAEAVAATA